MQILSFALCISMLSVNDLHQFHTICSDQNKYFIAFTDYILYNKYMNCQKNHWLLS